jgi:hypothetical protein
LGAATFTSLRDASFLSSVSFATFLEAGALAALAAAAGTRVASGAGAEASRAGGAADADVAASYSHAKPKAGARLNTANPATIDSFVIFRLLWVTAPWKFARLTPDCQSVPGGNALAGQ